MKKEQFINYLRHPEALNEDSLLELNNLISEYPYFQTAHLLLTKNLHDLENIKFNNQLKLAAAHIADRENLFHFLNTQPTKPSINLPLDPVVKQKTDEKNVALLKVVKTDDIISSPVEDQETIAPHHTESTKAGVGESVISTIEQIEAIQPSIEPPLIVPQDTIPASGQCSPDSPVESIADKVLRQVREIYLAREEKQKHLDSHKANLTTENAPSETKEDIPIPPAETKKAESYDTGFEILDFDFLETIEEGVGREEQISHEDPYSSFQLPLLELEQEGTEQIIPEFEYEGQSIVDENYEINKSFTDWISDFNRTDKATSYPKAEKEEGSNLIEKFLQARPGAIKATELTASIKDVSTDSIKEDEGLITETLVTIYIRQKKYAQALKAYEKLSLKYPEKRAYFAAQSEKVADLID